MSIQTTMEPNEMSGGALSYLGDAVLEVMVRTMLVKTGIGHAGELNARARNFVRATAQSDGVERLLPHLTEEEISVYHRGRNAAGPHPKSATVAQYRRATGLEALFGYLSLKNDTERLQYLFSLYVGNGEEKPNHAEDEKK